MDSCRPQEHGRKMILTSQGRSAARAASFVFWFASPLASLSFRPAAQAGRYVLQALCGIEIPQCVAEPARLVFRQDVADHAVEFEPDLVVVHRVLGVAAEIRNLLDDFAPALQP